MGMHTSVSSRDSLGLGPPPRALRLRVHGHLNVLGAPVQDLSLYPCLLRVPPAGAVSDGPAGLGRVRQVNRVSDGPAQWGPAGLGRVRQVNSLKDLLHECAAGEDQRWERNATGQLLHVPGELHGLELRDLGQLQRLGGGNDGDTLGDLEGLLQLLSTLRAEELVDGLLRLAQVAAHHAQTRDVQDHRDGEGDKTHDYVVQTQAAVRVRHPQGDGVIPGSGGAGGNTRIPSSVFKRHR